MIIIPIKDLKDTNKIAALARSTNEPIFVTKNGYGELVVMNKEVYDRNYARGLIDTALEESQASFKDVSELTDGEEFFNSFMVNK